VAIILLLVIAASGVAGLLYWWSGRFDAAGAHWPTVWYAPHPTPPRVETNGNGRAGHADTVDTPVSVPLAIGPQPVINRMPFRLGDPDHDDTETVRFVRPWDFPVQLLPGRLEVLEGTTPHREIRFLRVPGEPTHVILGREVGLTPHYIGLGSPTVSRRHARLDFADNQWIVKNLSRTNPTVVNDDELFDTDVARPLADGDRLELGDVVLRFHAH
jgi:hypothetical protein